MPSKRKKKTAVPSARSETGGPTAESRKDTAQPDTDKTSIILERAKRWETTPFIVESLMNTVAYCRTVKGQTEFQGWLRRRFEDINEYNAKREACNKPPEMSQKQIKVSSSGMNQLGLGSYELGLSPEALLYYLEFTFTSGIQKPERSRDASKGGHGKSAAMGNAGLSGSLAAGSKTPDVDWEELRRIALSEADRIRDTLLAWHTHPSTALYEVWTRKDFILMPEDEMLQSGLGVALQRLLNYAWRSNLYVAHIAHAHWSRAATLFEELARRELTTSSAIKRAYKSDVRLKWRLLSLMHLSQFYAERYWTFVCEVVVSQNAFRAYVEAFRDNDGKLHMSPKPGKILNDDSIEAKVQVLFTNRGNPTSAFKVLEEHFVEEPDDQKKFGPVAWHLLGVVAVAVKFDRALRYSTFGKTLLRAADDLGNLTTADLDLFHQEFHFLDRVQVPSTLEGCTGGQLCERLTDHLTNTWLHAIFAGPSVDNLLETLLQIPDVVCFDGHASESDLRESFTDPRILAELNTLCKEQDSFLWERAQSLGARVAPTFGLLDPEDQKAAVDSVESRCEPVPVPQPLEDVLRTTTTDAPTDTPAPEATEKTKDESGPAINADEPAREADASEELANEYPEILPPTFKLGKKNLHVFHQILGYKERTAVGDAKPKPGVVRWEQFEKAMKRIGFEVVQTARSSVRFDPPAKTARPITFHRPHPESVLPPFLLNWIGSRLNRCYGWTTSTFEYDPTLAGAT